MDSSKFWFTTYTGKKFYPFNPRIEDICIEDIAHSLSLICRFQGHLPEHYSVAQHSVLVSYLVPIELRLEGLLHDAAEAYIGDIIRPIKRHPSMSFVEDIEFNIEEKIIEKFKLSSRYSTDWFEIKKADSIALLTEKRDLFEVAETHVWTEDAQIANGGEGLSPSENHILMFVHPMFAKQQFLARYMELKRV